MGDARFYARSASDKTDDWPFWLVADSYQGGLNVTAALEEARNGFTRLQARRFATDRGARLSALLIASLQMAPFLLPIDAARLSAWANANIGGRPMAMWRQTRLEANSTDHIRTGGPQWLTISTLRPNAPIF